MRTLQGTVVSTRMHKTIVVRVDRLKKHPRYGKFYRMSKKFKAHDEKGGYRIGDVILMQETRPISKEKRWRVLQLVKRPDETEGEKEETKV